MLTRRELLKRAVRGAPLLALGTSVPGFLARTARAVEGGTKTQGKVLIVLELAGGNDALNVVVPYGDDLYHKARPTLGVKKEEIIRIDDYVGLNPSMGSLEKLLSDQHLALVQGVGYSNPNRSHTESMDIWHTADPKGHSRTGWLGQAIGLMPAIDGKIPGLYLGDGRLPLALQGSSVGVPTINPNRPYGLELGGLGPNDAATVSGQGKAASASNAAAKKLGQESVAARKQLIHELTAIAPNSPSSMAQFVQRTSLETYATVDRLNEILTTARKDEGDRSGSLAGRLHLVARMIQADFGASVYFLSMAGFDTHGNQRTEHDNLLGQLAGALAQFFDVLGKNGHAERVVLMTFSEFGRRLRENDSHGTDHGAAACMFLAGPGVKGGLIGKHPSLSDLDDGDIKFHTDFRRVYATIVEDWLQCDSRQVLGEKFEKLPLFRG